MTCSRPVRHPAAYAPCSRPQRSAAFRSHSAAAAANRHRACPAQRSYHILNPEKPLRARIAAHSSGDSTETAAVPLVPFGQQRAIGAACGDDASTPPAFQGVPLGSSGNTSLLGAHPRTALTPAGDGIENACTTEGPIDPAVSERLLQSARAGTRVGSGEARTGTQRSREGAGGVEGDEAFMRIALEEARQASSKGEIPVGAVLVRGGCVIARAHNVVETTNDPTAHAEMRVMRDAARALGAWRLLGCTLYSTLEPCPMCAGALLQARVHRVVYGARNSLLGADGSWIHMLGGGEHAPAAREPAVTNAVQGSRRSRARTSVARSEGASVYYIPERSVRFMHSALLREAVWGAAGEGNSPGRECLDCGGDPNQSSSPRGLAGLGYESAAGGGEHASASVAEDRKALHPFHPDVQVRIVCARLQW